MSNWFCVYICFRMYNNECIYEVWWSFILQKNNSLILCDIDFVVRHVCFLIYTKEDICQVLWK